MEDATVTGSATANAAEADITDEVDLTKDPGKDFSGYEAMLTTASDSVTYYETFSEASEAAQKSADSTITNAHHIINSALTGSRSPAGPRRLRDSDAHKRIAVPQALCVLRECPRPRPKSGKVCRSDTRAGDVCERAERSEGSDTTLIRKGPCFAVCALVCDLSPKAECVYPLSGVKANVGRLWEKLKTGMRNGWG